MLVLLGTKCLCIHPVHLPEAFPTVTGFEPRTCHSISLQKKFTNIQLGDRNEFEPQDEVRDSSKQKMVGWSLNSWIMTQLHASRALTDLLFLFSVGR
jgi:hypothetical protein